MISDDLKSLEDRLIELDREIARLERERWDPYAERSSPALPGLRA